MPPPPAENISLADLAVLLGVNADRLPPLVIEGYLKLTKSGCCAEDTFVVRPRAGARDWLRSMFAPLEQRPMLPAKEAAKILNMGLTDLRRWCLHFNLPIYMDAAFGELISLRVFYQLQDGFFEIRNPMRTDRQALLVFLSKTSKDVTDRLVKPKKYSRRLEKEIQSICSLPEPQRTIQATMFWSAYKDANTVAECLGLLSANKRSVRFQVHTSRVRALERYMLGKTESRRKSRKRESVPTAAARGAQAHDETSASES
jgi:hypothetical protein